ncbi:MAG TPA: chalcone isomerase family protein [Burkholderiaceae bacterium]|nr:chalcone isomerase family protein [Burkholderiaceae bacterium]
MGDVEMNRMTSIRSIAVLLLAVAMLLVSSFSFALEVAGVRLAETARVANQDLQLNGAGIRYRAIFKVYAAGLYLTAKKTTVPEVLAASGARRIELVMLRDVSSESFGQAFLAGIRKNISKTDKAKLVPQLIKFGELFASIPELKKGDTLALDWIPNSGTLVQINGKKVIDSLPDIAFHDALLKIWIGDQPADAQLKRAMLGEKTNNNMTGNIP